MSGFRPVVSSFGSFLTGKNVEIRTSIAFNNAPVILVGTHGGLIGPDGPTQAGLQDISVMRSIPNIKVVQPSTEIETKKILQKYLNSKSKEIVYIRISREKTREFFNKNYQFKEGNISLIINNCKDALVLTSGPMLERCYNAIKNIKKYKIGLGNLSSIKPIDLKVLKKLSKKTKKIITVEDHNIMGGLGSAVNESLVKIKSKCEIHNYGLNDIFTQSGDVDSLYKYYRLDDHNLKNYFSKVLKNNP